MGRARTREPGALPTIPTIPPEQFRFDEVYHQAAAGDPALGTSPASAPFELPVRFASEVIDLRLEPPQLHVDALYVFRNRTSGAQSSRMFYPFPVDAAHPYPHDIQVEGAKFTPADRGILWQLAMQPHQETSVQVKYSQQCNDRSARYILKSTSNWGQPLEHATYRVRWPASLPNVNVSYSGTLTRDGDHMLLQFERDDFMPPRDLLITWGE